MALFWGKKNILLQGVKNVALLCGITNVALFWGVKNILLQGVKNIVYINLFGVFKNVALFQKLKNISLGN